MTYHIPNETEALQGLNVLLDLATQFDLIYPHDRNQAAHILEKLQEKVAVLFHNAPNPAQIDAFTHYPYDRYYTCLHHLYHHPLVFIDFGSQSKVNQGYIQVISCAQSCFATARWISGLTDISEAHY
ncbi:hypothetical protein [Staphylococcus lutrae]|uniref:Uncharacterized protein n=1 Tax=Staphylococcus lutrae TaxID=155085 RepID=A0AAC9RTA8_9STAP|nr:hypothetical protein [Staphylococcus lutrae]ARJ50472.1 hypothetical protein B5P37_03675 [Staphylococcus lutrae]